MAAASLAQPLGTTSENSPLAHQLVVITGLRHFPLVLHYIKFFRLFPLNHRVTRFQFGSYNQWPNKNSAFHQK